MAKGTAATPLEYEIGLFLDFVRSLGCTARHEHIGTVTIDSIFMASGILGRTVEDTTHVLNITAPSPKASDVVWQKAMETFSEKDRIQINVRLLKVVVDKEEVNDAGACQIGLRNPRPASAGGGWVDSFPP